MPVTKITTRAILILAWGVIVSAASGQTVLYVHDDASPGGDGLSWANAHRYLQDALIGAVAGTEIHVAGGTYKPDQDEAGNVTPGERTETLQLISGVALYGGYRGCPGGDCAGGDPDERDIDLYKTILTGDLLGDDAPVSCTQDSPDCDTFGGRCIDGFCIIRQNNDENSYHVVTGNDTNETAVLDGFTIASGNADSPGQENYDRGGGMYNSGSRPTLTNCTFSGNSAVVGGGMHNSRSSSPTLSNCTFSGNSAIFGGAMLNHGGSSPVLTNCTFIDNSARYSSGGGMYNYQSSPTLTDCTFSGNSARTYGGGMYNYFGSPTLTNCTFSGNTARRGGGMCNDYDSSPTLANCTFSGNTAASGGGMYNDGYSSPTLTNCTFSGNSADNGGGGMDNTSGSSPTLANCTFTGNTAGSGGGIQNVTGGSPVLTNCTFSRNSAGLDGGGMFNYVYGNSTMTDCTFIENSAIGVGGALAVDALGQVGPLTNCILWGNVDDADGSDGGPFGDESAQIHVSGTGASSVSYTCIQGLIPGEDFDNGTNIGDDPLFVPGPVGCYYLSQVAAGQAVDSPCVDTGSPASPLVDGTTRSDEGLDSGIADMGYHYPVTGLPLVMGDYDRDADVDLPDFGRFQSCFTGGGPADVSPCCRIFDFEADSDVDLDDYQAFQTALTGP